jgi:hypothetical protein
MEFYEAQKINKKWGNKPCEHIHLEKMYYGGAFLTVYACSECGREFTISEMLDMKESRRSASKKSA